MHPLYTYIKQSLAGTYADAEAAALAKAVLTDVFHFPAAELYAGKGTDFPPEARRKLEDILARLRQHEPLQYILGQVCFFGLPFEVSPDVLIPRPETSELLEWILVDCKGRSSLRVLDVGTGSGCIPVVLAQKLPGAQVTSWDVSAQALAVAARNVRRNQVNVRLEQVDVLSGDCPKPTIDVLVSNPPYIAEKERDAMDANVLEWEPGIALFVPDADPLLFYRRIAALGLELLAERGTLYYEINQAYGKETVDLLCRMGYRNVTLRKDLSGNDRMIKAIRP